MQLQVKQGAGILIRIISAEDPVLERIITRKPENLEQIASSVDKVLAAVKEKGDPAVCDFTARFDGARLSPEKMEVRESEIEAAYNKVDAGFLKALRLARGNIEDFHRRQLQNSWFTSKGDGVLLGQLLRPLARVGIYVPGGKASYPSSVLMNALPARVAGVEEVIMVTPPDKNGEVSPYTLVAAAEAGVHRIFKVGGAQAVAALAYGTEIIPKVDKITGPGNIYVTLAKRQVYGEVDIDMLAGPSEVLVIADSSADARFAAADLLSQAEHDEMASAILLTPDRELAEQVKREIVLQVEDLSRRDVISRSLSRHGAIILTSSLEEAFDIANRFAPEHLELVIENPFAWLGRVKNAGSVFVGPYSTEPLGDYLAGPNHILPTGGTARFYSPVGVDTFVKKSGLVAYSKQGLAGVGENVIKLAEVEGLTAHASAVRIRMEALRLGMPGIKSSMPGGLDTGTLFDSSTFKVPALEKSGSTFGKDTKVEFDASTLAREDLRSLVPYEPQVYDEVVKLDANENPFDFPKEILEKALGEIGGQTFSRYPDPLAESLREKLAEYSGVPADCILAGNGSDELILTLLLAFASGGRVLINAPTFSMYEVHSRIAAAEPVMLSRRFDFSVDMDRVLKEAQNPGSKVVFICSPNNPTGNTTPVEDIEKIARDLEKTNCLLVVDEAYAEFGGRTCLPLVERYPRLIVLRTFSKAFGLAGLRVGYLAAHPSVILELVRVKQPYNLNAFSQIVAKNILKNISLFKSRIKQICSERNKLFSEMKNIPNVDVFPSEANFIMFKTSIPAERVYRDLLDRGILIRNVSVPGLENCLRVSVGRPEENRLFVIALKKTLGIR